jgi:hypothetical protein
MDLFKELFFTSNNKHTYDEIEKKDGTKIYLNIYLEPLEDDEYGKISKISIDVPHYFYNRDEGSVAIKQTVTTFIRTYDSKNGELLAILSPKWLTSRVLSAIKIVSKRTESLVDELLVPMIIKLGEREEELKTEFFEVRRFWMGDIPDLYIRGAGISGVRLQESPEYEKYIRRMSGKLMSIVYKWGGYTILLTSDGLIFSYSDFENEHVGYSFFKNMITKLDRVNAFEPMF